LELGSVDPTLFLLEGDKIAARPVCDRGDQDDNDCGGRDDCREDIIAEQRRQGKGEEKMWSIQISTVVASLIRRHKEQRRA
jgi:hypothetical protein